MNAPIIRFSHCLRLIFLYTFTVTCIIVSNAQTLNSEEKTKKVVELFREILSEKSSLVRNGELYEFFSNVHTDEYANLWESYSKTRDRVARYSEDTPGPAILQLMAAKKPKLAAKFALEENFPVARYKYLEAAFIGWAYHDPKSAVTWASRTLNPQIIERLAREGIVAVAKTDPQLAIQFLSENLQKKLAENFLTNVFKEWGKIDPEGAAKYLDNNPTLMGNSRIYTALAQEWAIQDNPSARDWVLTIKDPIIKRDSLSFISKIQDATEGKQQIETFDHLPFGRKRQLIVRGIAAKRSREDLEKTIEWMHSLSDRRDKSAAFSGMSNTWMTFDVASMLENMDLLLEGRSKDLLLSQAAGHYAAQDIDQATKWLKTLPVGSGRTDAIMSVASQLTEDNPEKAISWLKDLSNEQEFLRASTQTVQVLARAQPDLVIQFVRELPLGNIRDRIIWFSLVGLQSSHPSKAVELLIGEKLNDNIKSQIYGTVSRWSQEAFDDAYEYASSIEDSEQKTAVFMGLIPKWFSIDPKSARSFALKLENVEDRGKMIRIMLASQGGQNIEREIKWVQSLEPKELGKIVFPGLIGSIANHVPPKAAALVDVINDREVQDECSYIVIHAWRKFDAENAINWIRKRKDDDLRSSLYDAVLSYWVNENAEIVPTILENQKKDEETEAMIEIYVRNVVHINPESAVDWANRLKDPKSRVDHLISSLKVWHRKDPNKTAVWLESSGLPKEIKELITNPPEDKTDKQDDIA